MVGKAAALWLFSRYIRHLRTKVHKMNINVLLILCVFVFDSNTDSLSLNITGLGVRDEACTREVSCNQFDLYPIGNILEIALKLTGSKRLAVVFDHDYRFLGKYTAFSNIRVVLITTPFDE